VVTRRRAVQRVATTPERRRRAPIRRATTGFGDRRTLSRGRARSFLLVRSPLASTLRRSLLYPGIRVASRVRGEISSSFFYPSRFFPSPSFFPVLSPARHSECLVASSVRPPISISICVLFRDRPLISRLLRMTRCIVIWYPRCIAK